jgi:lipopolysaccharide export system permease protein
VPRSAGGPGDLSSDSRTLKILTRYLLREHAGPFAAALGALTVLLLVNQLARRLGDLAGKGLPAGVIAEVFALSVPFILAMTVPMAVLVAVLYAFGRLSADNELTALKASGVGLVRLLRPVVLAATVVAAGMVLFNDRVVPETNHALRKLLVDIGQKKPTFHLREQTVNPVVEGKLFLRAARIDRARNRLYDVVIFDLGGRDLTRTIYADSGHMAFNETQTDLYLTLYDGELHEVDFRDPAAAQIARFREHVVRAPGVQDRLERGRGGEFRGDREMNIAMMRERVAAARAARRAALDSARAITARALAIAETGAPDAGPPGPAGGAAASVPGPAPSDRGAPESDGAPGGGRPFPKRLPLARSARDPRLVLAPETAAARAQRASPVPGAGARPAPAGLLSPGRPAPVAGPDALEQVARLAAEFAARYREQAQRAEIQRREMNRYLVEIHKKFAIAFAAIVFALVGAPVAARFPRGGIGMVLLVSLVVFNVYWVGLIAGEDLADRGILSPFWAMWAPNALFLGIAAALLYGEARQSATARGGGWEELWEVARRAPAAPVRAWRRRRARRRAAAAGTGAVGRTARADAGRGEAQA